MHKKDAVKILGVIIAAVFLVTGCDSINKLLNKNQASSKKREYFVPEGKIIAKVNDMVISLEELDSYVKNYNKQIDDLKEMYPEEDIGIKKIETTEQKIELLKNDLVRQRLLYQEALDKGLDKKDDVKKAVGEFNMSLLVASLIKEEVESIKVTSTDIESYYNNNKNLMREAEERRVRMIMTKSESQAKAALIEVLQGTDFGEAAKKHSVDKSASNGGDLGFIIPGTKFPQFDIAIYSLDVGGVSQVLKDPNANDYYIVKVEEKKGGKEKPLSELWDNIKAKLEQDKQKEAIDALVGKLMREAKIDIQTSEIK
ncbi:MAG: peptidyl-prolyl cis-trans isomerase [Candidatus Omnitrophota bacterium]|nr:peptidyl-prolyl cis-trans isomerase [Candidatus Omnitrophota bacterium]